MKMAKTNLTQSTYLHGVFLQIFDLGILLTGESGIGKSEIALGLLHRDHRLIADDSILLKKTDPNTLIGECPPLLKNFLEVRGLGILNIEAMFGDTAIVESKSLDLIIHLINTSSEELKACDRLNGCYQQRQILDIDIPEVTIPVAAGRNLSVLVEVAVRNHVLKTNGYNPVEEFLERQSILMENRK